MADTWSVTRDDYYNPRAGDTPGFGTGGGGSVGGGGGYGVTTGGLLAGGGDRGGPSLYDNNPYAGMVESQSQRMQRLVQEDLQRYYAQQAAEAAALNAARIAAERASYVAPPVVTTPQTTTTAADNATRIAAERAAYEQQQRQQAALEARSGGTPGFTADTGRINPLVGLLFSQAATGPLTRGGPASVQADIAARNRLITDTTGKIIGVESGGDPLAKAQTSSATGLGQFTEGTWMNIVSKYRPDLLEGRTKKEVLSLRTDPDLSIEMTGNLTRENANYLESKGLPVNENSLYLSHFLGAGDAAKVLKADPTTPISDIVQERSITANPKILGGDKTASDLTKWASNLMGTATSYSTADMGTAGTQAGFTGDRDFVTSAGMTPVEIGPNRGYDPSYTAPGGLLDGAGPNKAYADTTATQPGILDGLFGGDEALQKRIEELKKQRKFSAYGPELTAEQAMQLYADEFAGGDISKVKTRITNFGEGDVLDFYVKDWGDALSQLGTGITQGVTNLFGGLTGGLLDGNGQKETKTDVVTPIDGTIRTDKTDKTDVVVTPGGGGGGGGGTAAVTETPTTVKPDFSSLPTLDQLSRSPTAWLDYYNRIPQNYGYNMVQAPYITPQIRGIFS